MGESDGYSKFVGGRFLTDGGDASLKAGSSQPSYLDLSFPKPQNLLQERSGMDLEEWDGSKFQKTSKNCSH